MIKFYVAGKFEEKERTRRMIAELRKLGWHCAHDWTWGNEAPDEMELRDIAIWERNAASSCNVLVLLGHRNGRGSFVEAGCALGQAIPVLMVTDDAGRYTAPLYHPLVSVFQTDEKLVDALRTGKVDSIDDADAGDNWRGIDG